VSIVASAKSNRLLCGDSIHPFSAQAQGGVQDVHRMEDEDKDDDDENGTEDFSC
jgi:hypothetical protein